MTAISWRGWHDNNSMTLWAWETFISWRCGHNNKLSTISWRWGHTKHSYHDVVGIPNIHIMPLWAWETFISWCCGMKNIHILLSLLRAYITSIHIIMMRAWHKHCIYFISYPNVEGMTWHSYRVAAAFIGDQTNSRIFQFDVISIFPTMTPERSRFRYDDFRHF